VRETVSKVSTHTAHGQSAQVDDDVLAENLLQCAAVHGHQLIEIHLVLNAVLVQIGYTVSAYTERMPQTILNLRYK